MKWDALCTLWRRVEARGESLHYVLRSVGEDGAARFPTYGPSWDEQIHKDAVTLAHYARRYLKATIEDPLGPKR